MITYKCPDCGEILQQFDEKYVQQNPTGFELACEQLQLRHDTDAHPETWHIEICPDCGNQVGSWPQEYIQNNPNASSIAIEQAYSEHALVCPSSEYACTEGNWDKWREEAGALPGETPRQLIRRLTSEGMPANEICDTVPVPPDRWRVQNGEVVTNWYKY